MKNKNLNKSSTENKQLKENSTQTQNEEYTNLNNVNTKANESTTNSLNDKASIYQKYIMNKDITNDIAIEDYDKLTQIPKIIIYNSHKFILTTNLIKHKKNKYKCILWRRIKDKTVNNFNFCSSTITCKINKKMKEIIILVKSIL